MSARALWGVGVRGGGRGGRGKEGRKGASEEGGRKGGREEALRRKERYDKGGGEKAHSLAGAKSRELKPKRRVPTKLAIATMAKPVALWG